MTAIRNRIEQLVKFAVPAHMPLETLIEPDPDDSASAAVSELMSVADKMLDDRLSDCALQVSTTEHVTAGSNPWPEVLQLFDAVIAEIRKFGGLTALARRSTEGEEADLLEHVLASFHYQACLVADEISCLLSRGYMEGAQRSWRTLFEHAVKSIVIAKAGRQAAIRFHAHAAVSTYRNAEALSKLGYMSDEVLEAYQEAMSQARTLHGLRKGDYGWAYDIEGLPELKWKSLCDFAGQLELLPYYSLTSSRVHSDATTLIRWLKTEDPAAQRPCDRDILGVLLHYTMIGLRLTLAACIFGGPRAEVSALEYLGVCGAKRYHERIEELVAPRT